MLNSKVKYKIAGNFDSKSTIFFSKKKVILFYNDKVLKKNC